MSLPVDRTISLNQSKFHFREAGDSSLPHMLLLHGGGQTSHMWDTFAESMGGSLHLIALDQRGHGESEWEKSADYSPDAFQSDLDIFVSSLGLAPLHLCGLSMGGLNALLFAGRRPQNVLSLTLVDVAPRISTEGAERIREFYRGAAEFSDFNQFVEYAQEFNPRRTREQLHGSMQHSLRRSEDGRWNWKFDLRLLDTQDWGSRGTVERLWQAVAAVQCPALIIRGGASEVMDEPTAVELAQRFHDGRQLTIPSAGHSVVGDSPKAFFLAMQSFLRQQQVIK